MQIQIAELLLNPEDRRTKKDKIGSIGLPERTFYKWMKDIRFIDYLNSRISEFVNSELSEVWKALLMQCKRGNVQAIKLFFEMQELDPNIKIKREEFNFKMHIEREKLELEKQKKGSAENAIAAHNEKILTLKDLILNPVPDRHKEDFEDEGDA